MNRKKLSREEILNQINQIESKNISSLCAKLTQTKKYENLINQIIRDTEYLPNDCKITERLYQIFHNLTSRPLCKNCKQNYTKFKDFNAGYHNFCSRKCSDTSIETKEKRQQTNIERYGVPHVTQIAEVREKTKQTNIKKYGVECPFQSPKVKEKRKQTMLERYGVEQPIQSPEIREKIRKSFVEKYGVEYPLQSPEIMEKKRQTCLKKYGVEHPLQSSEIKKKEKITK